MAILQPSTLLDPKENYIGNTVPWDGHCPFCRLGTVNGVATCGWRTTADPRMLIGSNFRAANATMVSVCTKMAVGTAPSSAQAVKVSPLAAVVAPAKPLINCPLCGAYAADKHRRGCKTGAI